MKTCSKCKIEKIETDFYPKKGSIRGYSSRCKKCLREYNTKLYRKLRKRNPEIYAEKQKKWSRDNPEKRKEIHKKWRRKLKRETMNAYGKICQCCGEKEIKFLAIDHINENGAMERKQLGANGGGCNFYALLKKRGFPKGYQTLCHNCNFAKSHYGKCPHK